MPLTGTRNRTGTEPRLAPRRCRFADSVFSRQNMRPVPLLLLLSSLLLSSHLRPAAGRARLLPGWLDGRGRFQAQHLEEMLLRAAAAAAAGSDDIIRVNQRTEPDWLPPMEVQEEEESQPLKRSEEPPLSIDLTFHLLRNMIQMARTESQREQALLNRKVLDEVGK